MKLLSKIFSIAVILSAAIASTSCEKGRSYSEMLNDENAAVNRFLVDQQVLTEIPADSVFKTGADAPYYQMDDEGNVYMQVISVGDGPRATDDQLVYFRFMRYNLSYYAGSLSDCPSEGNQNDMTQAALCFRYNNYTLPSSSQYGSGLQVPLNYLPLGSEVNLVIKSQYGWTSEVSNVVPYLYHVRYYQSMI